MKSCKKIVTLLLLCVTPIVSAQVKKVQNDKNNDRQNSDMSVRARSFYESTAMNAGNAPWSRVIYRELDLHNGPNASLYFPEEPMEGQTNLFRLMVNLMADNKLKAYEYLDGREIFNEKYELNVKDMLDKFHIIYEEKPSRSSKLAVYEIDESDIPCNEVLSYYIKERWVFDQQGSMFFSQIEAICPILHRTGDFGGDVTKYPMFWLPYETLRPYLTQHQVMSEGMNNTLRYTFDDFFALRKYKGDIYKTLNLRNQSLMQQYPNPDSLKIAREKIEKDLEHFENSLWVSAPDPAAAAPKAKAAKGTTETVTAEGAQITEETPAEEKNGRSVRPASSNRSNPREKNKDGNSSKSSKASKSSGSAPVRSVRRTR